MGKDIGIDLGSSTISVYLKGKGIVLNEPSLVAIDKQTGTVIKFGREAKQIAKRIPGNITALRPLYGGVNGRYDIYTRMLEYFMKKACGSLKFKPRVIICVPPGLTEEDEHGVKEAVIAAGAKKVYLIEEPIAAAAGAGVDITLPDGNMIINTGGSSTVAAVISLNGIIESETIKTAGDSFNSSIADYIREYYNIIIEDETAEEIKTSIGTVGSSKNERQLKINGINCNNGLPHTISVASEEIADILKKEAEDIASAALDILELIPHELYEDIIKNGIILTGGGTLDGMCEFLENATGIKTRLAEDPDICAIKGIGYLMGRLPDLPEDAVYITKH